MKKTNSIHLDGVLALLVGILIIIFPLKVFTYVSLVIGILLVIAGVRRLIGKINNKSNRVVNSILMTLIGVALMGPVFPWFPVDASDVLGYLIGAMLVYNGSSRIIRYRKVKTPMNQSFANAGIVAIVMGLIIAFVPFVSDAIIIITTILVALILIGYGILRLFVHMNVMSRYQEFKQEFTAEDGQDIVDVEVEDE